MNLNRKIYSNLLGALVLLANFSLGCEVANAKAVSRNFDFSSGNIMDNFLRPAIPKYLSSDESWRPGGMGLGFGHYLEDRHILSPPYVQLLNEHYSNLPGPPDSGLLHALSTYDIPDSVIGPPQLTLEWIPAQEVGGIYAIEGSGACQLWVLLRIFHKYTKQIATPRIFESPICGRDGNDIGSYGDESYFGVVGGAVVVIRTHEALNSKKVDQIDVSLQVLAPGYRWTNPVEVVVASYGNEAPY